MLAKDELPLRLDTAAAAGIHTQWSPCRSRFHAGKYSNAKLYPCPEKGEAADISFDRGESWRQGKGGLISRVWGYGEEGWLIGSSLNSSIQAVPIILLSNFIDGCRMT